MRRPGRAARTRLTVLAAAGILIGGPVALSACAAETPAPPPVTVTATVTETVTVTPTPPPEAAPQEPAAPEDPEAPPPSPNAPAPVVEWGPANDLGPRPGANGAPELDADGAPERYSVVEGDSFFDIAQRFELPQQQLLRMNPQIHDFGETVYIGQLINLDWQKEGVD